MCTFLRLSQNNYIWFDSDWLCGRYILLAAVLKEDILLKIIKVGKGKGALRGEKLDQGFVNICVKRSRKVSEGRDTGGVSTLKV